MYARTVTLSPFLLLCTIVGCLSTRSSTPPPITSFVDPAFRDHIFRRIAVVADTADLAWRLKLEERLVETFTTRGVAAVEGTAIIPPTRVWDDRIARAAFAADSIDSWLTLEIIASGEWENHVPAKTSTTVTRERETTKKSGRDTADHEEVTITTTTKQEGGYTERTPWTRYTIRLIDVATGEVAWMATNSINGNPDDRLGSFCREIVVQLQRDRLVRMLPGDSIAVTTGD